MSGKWGSLPAMAESDSTLAPGIREQITRPRPLVVEGPLLHQPTSQQSHQSQKKLTPADCSADPLTLHTIQLLGYSKQMRQLIVTSQQQLLEHHDVTELPIPPPIPQYTGPQMKHVIKTSIPFLPKDLDSDFVRGIGTAPVELDTSTNRRLLRKAVATVCAHSGYDSCGGSVLETLTDVTHEFFLHVTQTLRSVVDQQAFHGATAFQDPIEQVFQELGMGSVSTLHDFYQNRIISYQGHMVEVCEGLEAEYTRLLEHPHKFVQKAQDDIRVIKLKDEPLTSINFPVSEDGEEMVDTEQLLQLEGFDGLDMTAAEAADALDSIKPEIIDKHDSYEDSGGEPETPSSEPERTPDASALVSPTLSSPPGFNKPKRRRKR